MRWTVKSAATALFAGAIWAIGLAATPAFAEKRVALVIGNDKYANLPADQQLQKAVNDSRAVGVALGKLGFEIISGENVTRAQLVDKFDEFTRKLAPGDVAFMFFAGHGVALDRGNYILPTDIPTIEGDQATRLSRAALSESEIVSDLQSRNVRVAIVVLDACRNNPFKRPGQRSVGAERGLTRIDPVRGVFSIYSAGAGQSALDRLGDRDDNPNSVFTRVLVPALGKPGVPLPDLAFEVREQVAKLASSVGHDQRPAYYDETIGGRVYLAGLPSPSVQLDAGGAPPVAAMVDPCALAEAHWRSVESIGTAAAYEDHATRFPLCAFAVLARAKIEQLKGPQVASLPKAGLPLPAAKSSSLVRGGASLDRLMPASGRIYFSSSAVAPDKSWIATGYRDGSIRIWDVATGRATRILRRHSNTVSKLYASPDGRTLMSIGSDDRIVVWDVATFTIRAEVEQPYDSEKKLDADRTALSADGSTLVIVATTRKVQVRDAVTLAKRGEYDLGYWITAVSVSADGTRIGAVNDWDDRTNPNSIVVADARSGRILAKMSRPKEPDYYAMEFFENNRVVLRDSDGRYKMIDVGTGSTVWDIPKGDTYYYKFRMLYDERLVMLDGSSEFSFRDVTTGREVHHFKVDRDKVKTEVPDQAFVVSDGSGPMLVDADGAVVRRFDGIAQYASAPGFLQNSRSIVMSGKTGPVALDLATGQISQPFGSDEVSYIRTAADGSKLMTYYKGRVKIINAATGQLQNDVTISSGTNDKTYFSDNTADLKWITLVNGKRWEIWEIPEGKLVTSGTFPENARTDAIGSASLKLVLKRPNNETLDITEAASGKTVAQIKTAEKGYSIYDAVVSPNGRTMVYDNASTVIIYDLVNKRRIARSDKLEKQNPFYLPKGERIYGGDTILEAATGRVQQKLPEGLIGYKSSVTFSPDEKYVVVTKDYGADIWDFERQRKLATFYRFIDGEWALVTNDGYSTSKNGAKHLALEAGSELRPIDDTFRSAFAREATPVEPAAAVRR